ncbi:hypothetical protein [Hydrogenophaga sp.]|uniref:hypothetical protein n=1 Tax=Hydrogenophaga sp. TaxID=1904254 RepID=UPI002610B0CC|nr:hypothetical protein [Hydrogenophaga sp.]MCW5654255.1 hypothetical protein [Hydrogenophaga sp.]
MPKIAPTPVLRHYLALTPRTGGRLAPLPWPGSMALYARDLHQAVGAVDLPPVLAGRWRTTARTLERLEEMDQLYALDMEKRGEVRDYADFVIDPDRRKDLQARVDRLRADPELWQDLTSPQGAGLNESHLLALIDRLHFGHMGVFQATTPAAPLWWHGQPALLHAFAPSVLLVEQALQGMAESGRFPLEKSHYRSKMSCLFRGVDSLASVFPEGEPAPGGSALAMTLQSCAATPGDSFAATKPRKRPHELVMLQPDRVPAVNMRRVIDAGFSAEFSWNETLLPIRSSGLTVVADQARARAALAAENIEPKGQRQLFVTPFTLPEATMEALTKELDKGMRPGGAATAAAAGSTPTWQQVLAREGSGGAAPSGGAARAAVL